ncbi:response regulator transcription factor [Candidatus Magnetaquicoccus inordinatus]|uniref:response regulator transcription factor n=1 Tax=Candidatus Magnetaquicoccus inordinatus TaxID=2496818 RepID=UPI00102B3921|nr:response regulator transcription factor [Candidatus Magnetaquicoccus inordinatus]
MENDPPILLLVDDDQELCAMLQRYLTTEGFRCQSVFDGEAALECALNQPFDAIILDLMLPRVNGFEVLKRLRKVSAVPVLMLTARGDDSHSILGLEGGADDYLTKPCNPKVLVARVRAVLRRVQPNTESAQNSSVLQVGAMKLYAASHLATLSGKSLELTSAEFSLLKLLLQRAGEAVSKELLCQKGLGRKLTSYDRSVDIHISNLRRKLAAVKGGKAEIVTVRGVGYLYALPVEE